MKNERVMRSIRRRIATALMLVVMIVQSPVAELFGTGVIRAQALEPADISVYQDRNNPYKCSPYDIAQVYIKDRDNGAVL